MAKAAAKHGERAEAADLYGKAADMYEAEFGTDDSDVAKCRAKARKLSAAPSSCSCFGL